jgi:hypothetical protein
MRYWLTILLIASTFAAAIPLRKGATLGYKVWRGWEKDSTFATLTVLDSTVTDSGILWRVGIRDSLVGGNRIRTASAALLNRGTDTIWNSASCLAAWDPSAQRLSDISWDGTSGPIPWGALSGNCFLKSGGYDSSWTPVPATITSYLLANGLRKFNYLLVDFNNWKTINSSKSAWLPDTGLGRFKDPISSEEWVLESISGRRILPNHSWDTTSKMNSMMAVGESWVWNVHQVLSRHDNTGSLIDTLDTSYTLRWRINTVFSDSEGWTRREVSGTGGTFSILLSPSTGASSTTSPDTVATWLSSGMLRSWSDSLSPDGLGLRDFFEGSAGTSLYHILANSSSFEAQHLITKPGAGLKELIDTTATGSFTDPYHRGSRRTYIYLAVHDSDTLIDAGLAAPSKAHRFPSLNTLADLRQELSTHPNSHVRITELSGRAATFAALEAMSALQSHHGVVLVELRDGETRAQGRLFLP